MFVCFCYNYSTRTLPCFDECYVSCEPDYRKYDIRLIVSGTNALEGTGRAISVPTWVLGDKCLRNRSCFQHNCCYGLFT